MADRTWPGDTLIAAAQRGDTEALTALVHGSYPHVHRFARTLCATPQDAEDAAQEALFILYRKIGMLRASGALASWMFRIVRNECLRRTRALLSHGPADPGRRGPGHRDDPGRRTGTTRPATPRGPPRRKPCCSWKPNASGPRSPPCPPTSDRC
ncbi:RNA polymerase sigma factor [Streptomyces cinereoruber]|uniref:RNA polymerase sigma factor n=1 Tax=Streptomyces cinereoruber TaxID=67260 RepID=UPI003629BFF2